MIEYYNIYCLDALAVYTQCIVAVGEKQQDNAYSIE